MTMSARRNNDNQHNIRDNASIIPVPSGYKDNVRYRQRTAGTGYGRSSGYARGRQYAQTGDGALFRCS